MPKKPPPPPNTVADKIKAFIKLLGEGEHGKNDREKFRDWCELMYCAHAKLAAESEAQADALEARYMQVVETYRDKDFIRNQMPQMMNIAMDVLEHGGVDFLGRIAGELNVLDAAQGQFFTPYEVSRMMAEMQVYDMKAHVEQHGFFTLGEPAAGAGSMVIAVADVLQQTHELDPMVSMLVETWELNYVTFQMCYLQLTWRGITAKCVRGNSLSMEVFETAWTPEVHLFYARHGRLFEKPPATAEDVSKAVDPLVAAALVESVVQPVEPEPELDPEPERPRKPVQLSLF